MRCFLLLKFAKIDNSDRKALDKFRKDIKTNDKVLTQDFDVTKSRANSKIIKAPYICLGSKVDLFNDKFIDKKELDESARPCVTLLHHN